MVQPEKSGEGHHILPVAISFFSLVLFFVLYLRFLRSNLKCSTHKSPTKPTV